MGRGYGARKRSVGVLAVAACAFAFGWAKPAAAAAPRLVEAPAQQAQGAVEGQEIPAADLIQPAALAEDLKSAEKPLVLAVGPRTMYGQAHIAGAEYVGAAATAEGLDALRRRAAGLNPDQWIVIYCGCCPWERCPNIRPAFAALRELGFRHVQALYIADNFGANWVKMGYPTAR